MALHPAAAQHAVQSPILYSKGKVTTHRPTPPPPVEVVAVHHLPAGWPPTGQQVVPHTQTVVLAGGQDLGGGGGGVCVCVRGEGVFVGVGVFFVGGGELT